MRTYYQILLLSLFYLSTWAQNPYHWRLTDDDGLPDMEIYDLHQDRRGYMWIATDGGLCRYDGQDIVTYTHSLQKKNSAASIQEDSKGNIWYKNFAGQLFFIDSSNTVQLLPLPKHIKLNVYFKYSLTRNGLHIASTSYFYHYLFEQQKWTTDTIIYAHKKNCSVGVSAYHQVDDSTLIYLDCTHKLWLKKKEKLYFKGIIANQTAQESKLATLTKDSVILYSKNKIYIDHIDHIHQLKDECLVFNQEGIYRVYVYKKTIFVLTQQGLFILQKNTHTNLWEIKNQVLVQEPIGAFCVDREGDFWIGTLGNGLSIIPSLKMYYFDTQNSAIPHSQISALAKTKQEDLFIGMKGTLLKLNTQSLALTQYPPVGIYPVINILPDEKRNQVLFNSRENYTLSLSSKEIEVCCSDLGHHAILYKEDQLISGSFILLTTYSLIGKPGLKAPPSYVFDKKVTHSLDKSNKACAKGFYQGAIMTKRITALWTDLTDTSRFWAGANDSLFYWQNMIPHPVLSKTGDMITPIDITQTKDSIIWVATSNQGLYGIKNEQAIYHFTMADGLPSNNCKTLAVDYPYIWIGTNQGIVKLHPASKKINIYNQLDGLLTNNIDHIEIANQQVWAATNKGLIRFDVNTPSINLTPPLIHIKKWEVNDSSYNLNTSIPFPYQQNNLKFTFQALTLKSRNAYTYEYRLLGVDSTWIQQASSTNFVRFLNLNAGSYTFEVRARNEDDILSQKSAVISFRILPPYWETWWFRGIVGLTILVLLISIIRLRYEFLRRKQVTQNLITQLKMQALQAQMNPHFIFNAMSTIQSFWMYKDSKTALIYHAKFAKLMRLIFNYSNEKSIPIKEEIDFLKLYVDLEKIRLKYTIDIIFEVDPIFEEENLYMPPLLIQPIVENSFKHGFLHKEANGTLLIKFEKEGKYIKCTIEDNGVGRANAKSYNTWQDNTSSKKSSSFVTQDRLTMLNRSEGQFSKKTTYKITDLKDAQQNSIGTRTELWIPIIDDFFFQSIDKTKL